MKHFSPFWSCGFQMSLVLGGALLACRSAPAATYYVAAAKGDDRQSGTSHATAWNTLQQAANEVRAGDTVIVAPGVYRGAIQLYAKGTPAAPIVFRAAEVGRDRVVITNAYPAIRSGAVKWTLKDASLGLYCIPFAGDAPARVLYDGVDLFPYASVEHLRTFTTANQAPGPRHGYAIDRVARLLYVRLHATGKYGSRDPNRHVMAVAPPTGTHREGTLVGAPQHYCFGVLGAGDAHVVLDGFTFETPGVAGVYTEANDVTVRRAWFRGCRTGVSGNYLDAFTTDLTGEDYYSLRLDPVAQRRSAARVTIEYCDYTQFPAYQDALELLGDPAIRAHVKDDWMLYWARKSAGGLPSERFKYEIGIASRIGRDWLIRRNHVHDAFEGLSCHAVWASVGLTVEENLFERLLDNAVETEDHARNMTIRRNVMIDTLEPFSFQPLRGPPWPGPIFFVQNIIFNTPEHTAIWLPPRPFPRGAFKMGIKIETPAWNSRGKNGEKVTKYVLPDPGLIIAHNTVMFSGGRLLSPQGDARVPIVGVKFVNNILAADYLVQRRPNPPWLASGHFEFANNAVAPATAGAEGPMGVTLENGGHAYSAISELKLRDFRPDSDSPMRNAAIPVPEAKLAWPDLGAIQPGDNWFPLDVGPLARGAPRDFYPAKRPSWKQ